MCNILVMGYDKRSYYLYEILKKSTSKYDAVYSSPKSFATEDIFSKSFDVIILPIPTKMSQGNVLKGYDINLEHIIDNCKDSKYVYASIGKNEVFDKVKGISLLNDEDFVLKNAYLTAKAAIRIAYEEKGLDCKSCMVVGNGRIGRYLCGILHRIKSEITLVSSDYKKLAEDSRYHRCIGYGQISEYLDECDIVFNTAPYNYFTYDELDAYKGNYLELASKPYGFLYDFEKLPRSVSMCPSLPGKYYPEAAAKIIYDSIVDFIAKE